MRGVSESLPKERSGSPVWKRKCSRPIGGREKVAILNAGNSISRSAASELACIGSRDCARNWGCTASGNVGSRLRPIRSTIGAVAPNLSNQDFSAAAPNQAWCGDITCIATDESRLYPAGLKDLCSGEIVDYAMSEPMTKYLVMQACFAPSQLGDLRRA